MTDSKTGKKTCVLLLDGLESILEVKELDQALNITPIFNQNKDSGWLYQVRKGGIRYKFEDFKTIKKN